MPNTLAISDLESAPYRVRSIQQGKQVLSRANGRFQAVVNGRCLLSFAEDVVLSFEWSAVGQSDDQGVKFSVQAREGFEPQLDGASLVDGGGLPLSWNEQSASLFTFVRTLDWYEAVKDALAKSCLVGTDL
jgi:hypothetical protein